MSRTLLLASFCLLAAPLPAQLISEVMYHPSDETGDGLEDKRYEWIEIYNENSDPVDLGGYVLGGVAFTFPPATYLAGRSHLVVCADQAAVRERHAISNTIGDWSPSTALDNSGERITLATVSGKVISTVSYNDRARWPAGADGAGHSLALRDPFLEVDDPDSWALSAAPGGTPGRPNAVAGPSPPVVLNEALLLTSGERWIELHNLSGAPVDLSGFFITDDRRDLDRAPLPAETSIPARGWLAFSDAELGLDFSLESPAPRERVFVALVDPSGARVVDAYSFEPTVAERSEARFPDGDEDVAPAAAPTRGAANRVDLVGGGDIVINEIHYHPLSNDPADEFIEVLNRGAAAVDLAGFSLARGVEFLFPALVLEGGGHLVVARDPARIAARYGLPAEKVLGPWYRERRDAQGNPVQEPAALADSGERIDLRDPAGNIADTVRYSEDGEWPHWPDGRGSSLELIDPFQDNNTGQAWDASDDSADSVPRTFTYTGLHAGGESELQICLLDRGIAIVDDISLRAGATEHVPNGDFEGGTSPWKIEGTHVHSGRTDRPDLVLSGDGSLKLIATSGGDNKVNRLEMDLPVNLNTGTSYTVSFTARWIVGSRMAMTRGYNHGLARTHVLPIPERLGTPGAPNSVTLRQETRVGAVNLGPVIDKVVQEPAVPQGGEPVTITARVRDSHGLSSVKLFHARDVSGQAWAFTEVEMEDPEGDGRFTATIPGQSLGTRVVFFITARDASPQEAAGRFPLPHLERTHPAVLDPEAAGASALRHAVYRHDARSVPTTHQDYRFVLHSRNEEYLFNRPVHSNDLVDGSFAFGGARRYFGARIRWSGSPFLRRRQWNNSYRVRFAGDEPLHGRLKSFNLENHGADGKERVSHYLIRWSNGPGIKVPYAQPWYARWQVNEQLGTLYEHVPQPDNSYISEWYPDEDDGDFFEMDDRFELTDQGTRASNLDGRVIFPPYPNSIYPTPDPEPDADGQRYAVWKENYRWYLNIRAKASEDDHTNLIEFSRILDPGRTSAQAFDAAIDSVADVEAMLRVWAVRMNTGDWDTWGTTRGKNCYLYRRPVSGKWVLLPWDMELNYENRRINDFGLPSSPASPIAVDGKFPEVGRMINRPIVRRRYYGILKEMVDGHFRSQFLAPYMDLLAANGTNNVGIGRPGGFIDQRAALIRGWLASSTYPGQRLVIETNGGNHILADAPSVELSGDAPAEVQRIVVLVEGAPVDPQPEVAFSSDDITGWSTAAIPLSVGTLRIDVQGYDSQDRLVDADTIHATYGETWPAPSIESIDPPGALGGATIAITGSGLHSGLKVLFDATQAAQVTYDEAANPGRLTVVVPAGLPSGPIEVRVRNADLKESNALPFTVQAALIRGDANMDTRIDLSDPVSILLATFGGVPARCDDALDANDDGVLDTTDPLHVLLYLYRGGPAPSAPFPQKGPDATADELGCGQGL